MSSLALVEYVHPFSGYKSHGESSRKVHATGTMETGKILSDSVGILTSSTGGNTWVGTYNK